MSAIEIKIFVHPAVFKFISFRFKVLPFFVSRTNTYGTLLYNSLVKHQHKNSKYDVPLNTSIYNTEMRLLLGQHTYQQQGWCLQTQKVIDFNRIVLDLIDQDFYSYMDLHTALGNKIYHTILAFREKYDFREEDLAIKTLEKKYERYRRVNGLTIKEKIS